MRVIVGNEAILRNDITVKQAIANLDFVRKRVWAPVSLAEPSHIWLKYPELADHVDYILVHFLPFWEGVSLDKAVDFVVAKYEILHARFPNKPIRNNFV